MAGQTDTELYHKDGKMLKDLIEKINHPDVGFRGTPFWAWNSKLEPEVLRKQIRVMKEMGMGGFFMHSRVGLNTKYLGDEWFECIRSCIDEAEKLGMKAWLYDEDRWPSGAAGGLVTNEVKYRIRELQMGDELPDGAVELATFAVVLRGTELQSMRRLGSMDAPVESGETKVIFSWQTAEPMSWYNGQTYLDTMNPEAVAKFIRVTHERYFSEIGDKFGKSVPGIFTDEPHYLPALFSDNTKTLRFNRGRQAQPYKSSSLPWTDRVPELFRKKYGYDLIEHLPELFFETAGEELSRTRLNFFDLVTELFVTSFAKQIGEWCDRHNLVFTGHVLCEDALMVQRLRVGAAMRFYEYMSMPGIDQLTERRAIYDTAKQCASVAHQFGRERRMSETYGVTGWDFPLFGHKALGDWQYALGINHRVHHLAWYSMAAEAKRDYPASIFYQAPWYKQYHVIEDYFARLGAALSEGEEVRDLLVIHPIESTWGWKHEPNLTDDERLEEDNRLIHLRNDILKVNIDFDYGDEAIMARHAAVEAGKLRVRSARYKAVLIPQLRTIRTTTLKLLADFAEAGGTVAYVGTPPRYADGVRSTLAADTFRYFTRVAPEDISEVFSPVARNISLRTPAGKEAASTLSLLKRGADFQTLFICNTGHDLDSFEQMEEPRVCERRLTLPEVEVRLKSNGRGEVVELDLGTGKFHAVESAFRDGWRIFRTSFAELGSRLFIEGDAPAALSERPALPTGESVLTLPENGWRVRRDEPNVLVLDHGRFRTDGGEWSEKLFFIKLDAALRALLGKPPRGGSMLQPYINAGRKPERTLRTELEFAFECREVPKCDVELAIERPELYSITVNGEALEPVDTGFWADPAVRKLKLPARMLEVGENRINLGCDYHEMLPGVEALFILGDFGVRDDAIVELPAAVKIGDWCAEGFPHYAGNFTYVCEADVPDPGKAPLFIEFGEWRGALLGVSVNGGELQLIPWAPFRMDIGKQLRPGKNEIAITVFGHRRNAHGPFYLEETWPVWNGPLQFKSYLQPVRRLVPCGLLEAPKLTR